MIRIQENKRENSVEIYLQIVYNRQVWNFEFFINEVQKEMPSMVKWPNYFPKMCPPEDSVDADGEIFRIIKDVAPDDKDFICHWILKKTRRKQYKKNGQECQCCGLSVLVSLEDAKEVMQIVPALGDNIAVAKMNAETGKMKHTPCDLHRNHYTWWVPISINNPSKLFKVVA